jgi:hypothetical protein
MCFGLICGIGGSIARISCQILISQKTHSTFAHPLVLLESLCWCEIKISLKTKIVLPQFWASSNLENISHSFLTSMAGCNASFAGNSATQAL